MIHGTLTLLWAKRQFCHLLIQCLMGRATKYWFRINNTVSLSIYRFEKCDYGRVKLKFVHFYIVFLNRIYLSRNICTVYVYNFCTINVHIWTFVRNKLIIIVIIKARVSARNTATMLIYCTTCMKMSYLVPEERNPFVAEARWRLARFVVDERVDLVNVRFRCRRYSCSRWRSGCSRRSSRSSRSRCSRCGGTSRW